AADRRLSPTGGPLKMGQARSESGSDSWSERTAGTSTNTPQRPYTIDGIAASSSVRKTRGVRSQSGQRSDRKIAMPSPTGAAISNARIDEYSVPQMKGN